MYTKDYTVLSSDTDALRRLRLSRLFTFLQEASIAHTTELGMGREKTLDRGLLWIITLQQLRIGRLPDYDERIRLLSWPGETMHVLFPRYYRLEDAEGGLLAEGSALWALMDLETRRVVFPEEHGIVIPEERTGAEPALPSALKPPADGEKGAFTVPYSYLDLNGHMNNTRYLDLAEDRMPERLRERPVRGICAEYSREARLGDEIALTASCTEDAYFIAGTSGGKKLFKLNLLYA